MESDKESTLITHLRHALDRITRREHTGECQPQLAPTPRQEPEEAEREEQALVQALHDTAADLSMTRDFEQTLDRIR